MKFNLQAIKSVLGKHYTPTLILTTLGFFTYKDITLMIVDGEGFMWLLKPLHQTFWGSIPLSLANFEVSAAVLGTILANLLGLNLHLYYWVWLVGILILNIEFYFMAFVLTKKRLVAFTAAVIFGVNFVAQWGVLQWTYTSFLERIITIFFLIPSFMFLHLYLEKLKFRYCLFAVLLFFLGIGVGQWGLVFGSAFMAYPLFWLVLQGKKLKYLLKMIAVSTSFLVIGIFFYLLHNINQSAVGPQISIGQFLTQPQKYHYIEQIPLQLSHWSSYLNLAKGVHIKNAGGLNFRINYKDLQTGAVTFFSDLKTNKENTHRVAFVYIIVALTIYFRLHKMRPLLLTIVFATLSILLINVYLQRYYPESQPGASRFLYLPTIWLSVFWSLFLWAVFWQKQGNRIYLGIILLAGYYLINSWLISISLHNRLYGNSSVYLAEKALFAYIEKKRPELVLNTLVVTPWDEMGCGETTFLNDQIGDGLILFMPEVNNCAPPGGWQKVASSSSSVIRLHYDKTCKCVIEEKLK